MKKPPVSILRIINNARIALGKKPRLALPKGETECANSCVVHNAFWRAGNLPAVRSNRIAYLSKRDANKLAKHWKTKPYNDTDQALAVRLPPQLKNFIRDFDAGKYPQLIRA